jgi:hypothetical protein
MQSIDFNVPSTLTPEEIGAWLTALAKLVESQEHLGLDIVTDVELDEHLVPDPGWAAIIVHLGRCPGRNAPPIKLAVKVVDPAPDMPTFEVSVGGLMQ